MKQSTALRKFIFPFPLKHSIDALNIYNYLVELIAVICERAAIWENRSESSHIAAPARVSLGAVSQFY